MSEAQIIVSAAMRLCDLRCCSCGEVIDDRVALVALDHGVSSMQIVHGAQHPKRCIDLLRAEAKVVLELTINGLRA